MPDALQLLRDANPRTEPDFDSEAGRLVADLAAATTREDYYRFPSPRRRPRALRIVAATATAAGIAAAVNTGVGASGHRASSPTSAQALAPAQGLTPAQGLAPTQAIVLAAARTAGEADHSGTAEVRITHGGAMWAAATIVWNGDDLSVTKHDPGRAQVGSQLRVVDGTMYGLDDHGNWVEEGAPGNVDPGSGETPSDYLAAVKADVGGATLRRITEGMQGLTTERQPDGSTVYRGAVAAGLVAQGTGFKDGQTLRVLPFGYIAHDEAANPSASLTAAITIGADNIVRSITVSWDSGSNAWIYQVTYSGLGATPAPQAPAGARPLRQSLRHQ